TLVVHDAVTAELATQLGLPVHALDQRGYGAGASQVRVPARSATNRPAYMMFTSGSTGGPKAVVVSQAAVAAYADAITPLLGPAPVIAAISSLATDLPGTAVFGALATGGTLVLAGSDLAEDADGLAGLFAGLPA